MEYLQIGNGRIYRAVKVLVNGCGDARSRVCQAASILSFIRENELPHDLYKKVQHVIDRATRKGPQIENGKVIQDKFENTKVFTKNKTSSKIADDIFEIYCEDLSNRKGGFLNDILL